MSSSGRSTNVHSADSRRAASSNARSLLHSRWDPGGRAKTGLYTKQGLRNMSKDGLMESVSQHCV